MDINIFENISERNRKVWISTTGYRILFVLKALIEKPRTIDELVELVKNNKIISKSASKDTLRITLNTLKASGCIFSRPSKTNNFKYELLSSPFCLNLTLKEVELLIELRNKLYQESDWEQVFSLNDLYEKIFSLTQNNEYILLERNTRLLGDVNRNILNSLLNPKIIGKKVLIKYLSPEYGEEDIYIVPKKINFENGKLYLRCFSFKYNVNAVFLINRILEVHYTEDNKDFPLDIEYQVVYELTGNAVLDFEKAEYETIIEKSENYIKVSASVDNEFFVIQRLLLFGSDFKILSPAFFREKLINKIMLIRKRYENDQ